MAYAFSGKNRVSTPATANASAAIRGIARFMIVASFCGASPHQGWHKVRAGEAHRSKTELSWNP